MNPKSTSKLLWKCCGKIGSLFITCRVSVAVKKWRSIGKTVYNERAGLTGLVGTT